MNTTQPTLREQVETALIQDPEKVEHEPECDTVCSHSYQAVVDTLVTLITQREHAARVDGAERVAAAVKPEPPGVVLPDDCVNCRNKKGKNLCGYHLGYRNKMEIVCVAASDALQSIKEEKS